MAEQARGRGRARSLRAPHCERPRAGCSLVLTPTPAGFMPLGPFDESSTDRARLPRRRAALVPGRHHLRAARALVLRQRRRRRGGPPRSHGEARIPPGSRGHRGLAPALLPLAPPRRRLRHLRLHRRPPGVRHARGLRALPRRGPPPRDARHQRAGPEPHLGPAPVVPARAARAAGLAGARLLRLERHAGSLRGGADHLPGLRAVELVVGSGGAGVLLAQVLRSPAGPELRQPRRAGGDAARRRLLAGDGRRRDAARRRALPLRARGHVLREPAGDARVPPRAPGAHGRALPGPDAARRGQPVARGRGGLLRPRGRVPHGVPFPHDAAPLRGRAAGGPLPDLRHPGADAAASGGVPVGALPPQPRRADARDGDGRGARRHGPRLRVRAGDAHQPRHPPPARAARGQPAAPHRADERAALLPPGDARDLLRRRDRDGGQRLPRRSQRRAHAHAVERRQERRLLPRGSAEARPAGHPGAGLPLRGRQRREAAGGPRLAALVDQAARRAAQAARRLRPRDAGALPPRQPARPRVRPEARRGRHPRRREPVPLRPARGDRSRRVEGLGAGRALRREPPRDGRRRALSPHARGARVLLDRPRAAPPRRGPRGRVRAARARRFVAAHPRHAGGSRAGPEHRAGRGPRALGPGAAVVRGAEAEARLRAAPGGRAGGRPPARPRRGARGSRSRRATPSAT